MIDLNLIKILENTLLEVPEYLSEDGKILKAKVYEDAMETNPNLIKLLLKNDSLRRVFFSNIDDVVVFDKQKLLWLLEHKEFLPDSYTRFRNKIGLVDKRENFISTMNDVVLNFPYKDSVLIGGQDKDDQKRNEVFLNELVASEEITRMLEPKVLVNAKRYSKGNIEENIKFIDNDNLIIKGNNLIVLSSILERYEGKIKCIYIDPPYNTESDSFGYNDNFSRSTWLVFMRNRLMFAKKLLSDDGVILIQCSFHQYPYLRVMADEIFTESCHQFDMNTLVRHPDRSLTGDKEFNDVVEYTLIYSKLPSFKMPKKAITKSVDDYQYSIILPKEPFEILNLGGKNVNVYLPNMVEINRSEGQESGLKTVSIRGSIREKNSSGRFYVANLENKIGSYPEGTLFQVPNMGDDALGYRLFELPKNGNKNGIYYQGKPLSSDTTYTPYPNFVDFKQKYNQVNAEGEVSFRNGKKPESYIKFYLEIFTEEEDIVLDFFLGSGTTASVAHKMRRKYIGIEQMNYIHDITLERLKKVIEGEQSGISKEMKWEGGGSFVYCELMENAHILIDEIQNSNESNIENIKSKIYKDNRIIPYIARKEILELDKEFNDMAIEEKKKSLISLVDKNKLYVNYSDMEDETYKVTDEDKKFTESFYKKGV